LRKFVGNISKQTAFVAGVTEMILIRRIEKAARKAVDAFFDVVRHYGQVPGTIFYQVRPDQKEA